MTRECPGPDPSPHGPKSFKVPAKAVDTHAHVLGPPPYIEGRSYTAPPAPPAAYLNMLDATGMAYGVLVQASVHGVDNSLLLETLAAHPDRLRGIAVAPPELPARDWQQMHDAGIRGLRINTLYGGGLGFDALDRFEAICLDHGWHLQFLTDARALAPLATRISQLKVPAVIDHMGHFPAADGIASPAAKLMIQLLKDGAWSKLSGAYRLAKPPYAETIPLAQALVAAAPERCVWGSDWPHVANHDAMPNIGALLDLLTMWVPDAVQRDAVLTTNAHRLYGF
ncbi:MAG TPA: amidohydrolase family protein [Acidiphilium sp.]|uniref:amidohydrolase family protein n=1 Tax=Acidiphilium sp. 37-64-53 TaxID=1970299 RepID=UPI00257EA6A7|nr:amidohydrolase family protein [Acidiphilium sp. 37-64-53]HQT89858.1 amidohydrolase family protein [Acidiphilium sp.]